MVDITPMEFFLWAHIKALMYTLLDDSEEDLTACIVEAAATITQKPGIFECSCQSLLCRCQLCIEVSGHMFEHLF
jgi:hypothetical protein